MLNYRQSLKLYNMAIPKYFIKNFFIYFHAEWYIVRIY